PAAILEAEDRLRGIVQAKAGRCDEAETELGMQEMPAPGVAFAWVFAVDQAIEIADIFRMIALAAAGTGELASIGERIFDPLWRCGMARQEIGSMRLRTVGGLEIGIALHVREETRCAKGIEPGARGNADPDTVGLEFLGARKGGQRQF